MNDATEQLTTPSQAYMAAVDLGSNSFHMVIARVVDGDIQLLHREKQKVQLAEGLNDQLVLSEEAIERGLAVLAQFADTLKPFAPQSVRVIATYTLRRARNAATFLRRAKTLFPFPIEVISGQEEARFIYQGVAHFEHFAGRRLVMDIGGGSTEFAIGEGLHPLRLSSRNMGCVSYALQHFPQGRISDKRFNRAILQAEQELEPIVSSFKTAGWQQAVGTSGTVKTIRDIVVGMGLSSNALELAHLLTLKDHLVAQENSYQLDLPGLTDDRKLLICSGLAILIALFRKLHIPGMTLSGGALREGVLYSMLPQLQHTDVRNRTVNSLMVRYFIDQRHAERVAEMAAELANQLQSRWDLNKFEGHSMLKCSALLHELGLLIEYKNHHHHGAYIINHSDLPGFTRAQQQLVMALVHNHRADISREIIARQTMTSVLLTVRLSRILRLAVILSMRRRHEVLPQVSISSKGEQLLLTMPAGWLEQHPLMRAELEQEVQYQQQAGWELLIK